MTDSQGFLYVTESGYPRVVKLSPSGLGPVMVAYSPTSTPSGRFQPYAVCLDSANNVFVMDAGNSGFYDSRVIKFNNAGVQLAIEATAYTTSPPISVPLGCVVDSSGFIYVSSLYALGITKLAPNGTQVAFFNQTTLPALYGDTQIALDSNGSLYLAVNGAQSVVKFNSSTGVQQQLFGLHCNVFGVAVDSQGRVYAGCDNLNTVLVYAANGTYLFNLTTANPPINDPRGLWLDASSNLLVADQGNSRIIRFLLAQSPISTSSVSSSSSASSLPSSSSSSTGSAASSSSSSSASSSTSSSVVSYVILYPFLLTSPSDVVTDSQGFLYVADSAANRVIKLPPSGLGPILVTYSPNATTTPATLNGPMGVCLDSASSVYVVDSKSGRLIKFNNAGVQQLTIPLSGTPYLCAVDPLGFIYISATFIQGITKLAPNGTQVAFFTTMPALLFQAQVKLDSNNSIFIADQGNKRIVKLSSTGVQQQVFNLSDSPYGVAVDSQGTVYASIYGGVIGVYAANGTFVRNLTHCQSATQQCARSVGGCKLQSVRC